MAWFWLLIGWEGLWRHRCWSWIPEWRSPWRSCAGTCWSSSTSASSTQCPCGGIPASLLSSQRWSLSLFYPLCLHLSLSLSLFLCSLSYPILNICGGCRRVLSISVDSWNKKNSIFLVWLCVYLLNCTAFCFTNIFLLSPSQYSCFYNSQHYIVGDL